ncbi:MAG: T9SS type A sorting domain-containing protein, partial [Phaeodactylibacter sp.]|nr:T9SS type A sorting domain-containing protein [Phaeodactylibacter sp.]
ITGAGGVTVASGGPYTMQSPLSTLAQDICLEEGCYTFTIYDAAGNGICCQAGRGSYILTNANGNVLASGGIFGSSQSASFCSSGNREGNTVSLSGNGQLSLYPNPTNGQLTVSFGLEEAAGVQARVVGLAGEVLLSVETSLEKGKQELELDLNALPAGMYFLELTTQGERYVKKFVVAR